MNRKVNKSLRAGWVAERLKAPVLKTGKGATPSWVQIPPHPPKKSFEKATLVGYPLRCVELSKGSRGIISFLQQQ